MTLRLIRSVFAVTAVVVAATCCSGGGRPSSGGGAASSTDPPAVEVPATTSAGEPPPTAGSVECAPPDGTTTIAFATVPGADVDLTSLDVHAPARTCNAPVVMWVHGGGYRSGDKANNMADKVRVFNDRGWILVSVNYRLTKPGEPTGAKFPDHFDDVAASIAWVKTHIGEYGGDPSRVAVLGHSAGADIVSNVVTNPTYLARHGLGLDAVLCAGPLDTEGFDKVQAGANDPDGEKEQWKVALGNNPNYLTETSATLLVKPGIGIPPMIAVVRGTSQRQQIETQFVDSLRRAGIAATTIDARSLTHEQVNRRIGAPGDTVMTAPVITFLTECFGS